MMPKENNNAGDATLAEFADAFFAEDGVLASSEVFESFEFRRQQLEMAVSFADALARGEHLCVEAPTGVGKSFAYLVPAVKMALATEKPVLITTETIHLQEQLMEKDLPLLRRMLGLEFNTALAKGRGNYLCRRRLRLVDHDRAASLPGMRMTDELDDLLDWERRTSDGSRADIDFPVGPMLWSLVCCEGGNCGGGKCPHYGSCFYWRARREWDTADIIVANHALFFTDLKLTELEDGENSLFPACAAVVFDEAHTLEDNAASHLGLQIKSKGMAALLRRLFDAKTGRGLLLRPGSDAAALRSLTAAATEAAGNFFASVSRWLDYGDDSCRRIHEPAFVPDVLSEYLNQLRVGLSKFAAAQDAEEDADFKQELESMALKCDGAASCVYSFMNLDLEGHVYWVEGGGGDDSITMYSAPVDVDGLLGEYLFNRPRPVLLTSATLSVRGSLDFFRRRVGFHGQCLTLDSPFDFRRQVEVRLAKAMPPPGHPDYLPVLCDHIRDSVALTGGKAFVLFTNLRQMRTCAENLSGEFDSNGWRLLLQDASIQRKILLREFREDVNSVIFGAASFWTGVDVPGESLSNVIITKLPFPVPSHPLIQARSEAIESRGGRPFFDYSLPVAVLKFKQGIGRLIRSRGDRGVIAVLDNRIISKSYGRVFLDSMPECDPVTV